MRSSYAAICFACLTLLPTNGLIRAEDLVTRKTEKGTVVGYVDTPRMPWTGDKYCVHDPSRPVPVIVIPAATDAERVGTAAPSDAIMLFDGQDLQAWKPTSWKVIDGAMQAGHESLESREAFGDCQLHIEFRTPTQPSENFMNRGNSGVLLMGKYEVQIFDSWHEHPQQIYPDGQAASIYGQTPPRVNACRAPGQWQSFDIVFTAPRFANGRVDHPGSITMLHNGVVVHLEQPIYGEMAHRQIVPLKEHASKLPLVLQGHGSPVEFRNVWIRPLERLPH
jgi:hypothetical protein